jgi:hypothetical protein
MYTIAMTHDDIVYAAGYIDGEGCITSSSCLSFRITVSSTDRNTLEWFKQTFGGSVNDQHLPDNPNHSVAWKWVICSKVELLKFLQLVYPHLKLKAPEAAVVVRYLTAYPMPMRGGRGRPPSQHADYLLAKETLRKLKTDRHHCRI